MNNESQEIITSLLLMAGFALTVTGSYFFTRAMDNLVASKSKLLRIFVITISSSLSFCVIGALIFIILFVTAPGEGFRR